MEDISNSGRRLGPLAALFLRLGVIGFGGPLAHIGLMEDQCVKQRKWVSREQFLEGLAVCNLLPGPTSTQLSIYLGYLRAGPLGGLLSGACFIFPAFVMVALLAWVYIQYGAIPQVGALFATIGPVVIAIIGNTLYRSGKTALARPLTWPIFLAACALTVFPLLPPSVNLLTILLAAGLVGILLFGQQKNQGGQAPPAPDAPTAGQETGAAPLPAPAEPPIDEQPSARQDGTRLTSYRRLKSALRAFGHEVPAGLAGAGGAPSAEFIRRIVAPTGDSGANFYQRVVGLAAPAAGLLIPLGLTFFKIGLLMFGGGLVVAPLLQQELVDSNHWLTTKQLVDGLALGQLTPGPVTTVATFAGYAVAGFPGAVIATIAVFAPSFILVLSLTPLLLRLRSSPLAKGFLTGITAGALGAIGAAALLFGRAVIVDPFTAIIALASLILLLRWNLNTTYLIFGAALLGVGRTLLHF